MSVSNLDLLPDLPMDISVELIDRNWN